MADHDTTDDVSSIAIASQPVAMAAAPPSSAATKVFGIVELAEQILLKMKTEDLFRAQRVCRQWKAVTESSSPCRKALFLKPGTAEDINIDHVHTSVVRSWQGRWPGKTAVADDHKPTCCEETIAFNPLLVKKLAGNPCDTLTEWALLNPRGLSRLHSKLLDVGEGASCRNMFISQPPLPYMTISVEVARETSIESWQLCFPYAIAQELWTPQDTLMVSPAKMCELGQGTTLGELSDSLNANLKDYRKPHTDALWTFAGTKSR